MTISEEQLQAIQEITDSVQATFARAAQDALPALQAMAQSLSQFYEQWRQVMFAAFPAGLVMSQCPECHGYHYLPAQADVCLLASLKRHLVTCDNLQVTFSMAAGPDQAGDIFGSSVLEQLRTCHHLTSHHSACNFEAVTIYYRQQFLTAPQPKIAQEA